MNNLKKELLEKELKILEKRKKGAMYAPECNKGFINLCDKKIKEIERKLRS